MPLFIGGPAHGMVFDVADYVDLALIRNDKYCNTYMEAPYQVHVASAEQHRYVRYPIDAMVGCTTLRLFYFVHDSLTVENAETIARLVSGLNDGR